MIEFITQAIFGNFMGRAAVAMVGLSGMTSLLGCFILWRRLTFLGDALGHAALLGVVLGIALHIDYTLTVILLSVGIGGLLSTLHGSKRLPSDIYLSILSYSSLSLGLVILSLLPRLKVDPMSILFGDILAISLSDLCWIWGSLIIVFALFFVGWRWLLLLTLDEDMAQLSGVPVKTVDACLLGVMALTIAVGIKAIGALLLPALLIFPAATVRFFSTTPEQMVCRSMGLSIFTSCLGLILSFWLNIPTGPMIVLTYLAIFMMSLWSPSTRTLNQSGGG